MLRKLHNRNVRPVHIPDYKFYMCHPDFVEHCRNATEEDPDFNALEKGEVLAFRCQIASELYDEEALEVKERIEEENEAAYQRRLAVFNGLAGDEEEGNADQAV